MSRPLALWLKENYKLIRLLLLVLVSIPAINLYLQYSNQSLGVNPLQTLQQQTGIWAMVFLCITLLITPLRRQLTQLSQQLHSRYGKRLSDWNWIIRSRRLFGLSCFFYATLHLAIYVHFDLDYDLAWALEDLQQKTYLGVGLIAWFMLFLLAITSPAFAMKLLGRNWRRLHRLIYILALLSLAHQWMAVKAGIYTPWYFSAVILLLLLYRLMAAYGWLIGKARDDGMEVRPRQTKS
jgi:sulfoxide reductase heme-binding subunit YedZ